MIPLCLLDSILLNAHPDSVSLHKIIECFGLEGTFKSHLVQPPCNEQGHLQLDQVAQLICEAHINSFNISQVKLSAIKTGLTLCLGDTINQTVPFA